MKPGSIAVVVTHTPDAPGRAATLRNVLRAVPHATVSPDRERRGPWPASRDAWLLGARAGCEYVLLLQDDVIIPPRYLDHVHRQLAALQAGGVSPDAISHYHYRKSAPQAGWYRTQDALSGQALMLPTRHVGNFVRWCDHVLRWDRTAHSDVRLQLWLMAGERHAYLSAPSLCDHDLSVRSTIGGPTKAGTNGRRCLDYVGDTPPEAIAWWGARDAKLIPVAPATRRLFTRTMEALRAPPV